MPLYRAHSRRYLVEQAGSFANPNLNRERNPRDMPISLHMEIGEWFEKNVGINYRSKALFCTGDIGIARGYLDNEKALIELVPIGSYSICFSPKCKDLFGHLQFCCRGSFENLLGVDSLLDDIGFIETKNGGIEVAAASGNEVMIFANTFAYRVRK